MKKFNIFYLLLVLLAIAVTAVVLYRDVKKASLTPDINKVDTVIVKDTIFIHDTIYIEKIKGKQLSPVEVFTNELHKIIQTELGPFYKKYKSLTEENIDQAKSYFDKCEAAAKHQYDQLVAEFTKKYPEEVDYINNLVSMELTAAMKPYLHMLNEYGNRKNQN